MQGSVRIPLTHVHPMQHDRAHKGGEGKIVLTGKGEVKPACCRVLRLHELKPDPNVDQHRQVGAEPKQQLTPTRSGRGALVRQQLLHHLTGHMPRT